MAVHLHLHIAAAEGEAFLYGIQHAIENQTPFICISAGGGMRMMESLISLSQMTRTTLAINELKKNGLPYLVCITDPTAGGITASYAMLGDIHSRSARLFLVVNSTTPKVWALSY